MEVAGGGHVRSAEKGQYPNIVQRGNGLPLEERTVDLGWKAVIVDDTPDRQALFFTFDGPGTLTLRDASGKEGRHVAPARMQFSTRVRYLHGLNRRLRCPSWARSALASSPSRVGAGGWSTDNSCKRPTAMAALASWVTAKFAVLDAGALRLAKRLIHAHLCLRGGVRRFGNTPFGRGKECGVAGLLPPRAPWNSASSRTGLWVRPGAWD